MKANFTFLVLLIAISTVAWRQQSLNRIKNANVFDGGYEKLQIGVDVLVEDNLIREIGKNLSANNAEVIDANGKILIPGLIDAHWHSYYAYTPKSTLVRGDMGATMLLEL